MVTTQISLQKEGQLLPQPFSLMTESSSWGVWALEWP